MSASLGLLDRSVLLDVAEHHFGHGWFPLPSRRGKKPALDTYTEWARLAKSGERAPWEDILLTFHGPGVAGVGHLILAGFCVVDVDGRPGEAILARGPLPECPEVVTRHGRHLYFAVAKSLPSFRRLGPRIHLLGPGHFVELPPSPGKEWVRHVHGDLPRLPKHLRLLVQQPAASPTAGPGADTDAELAAWRGLLGALRGSGPWRARCPLHDDDRDSFSVFRGRADGRLLGRCHAGCGFWTLKTLHHRLAGRLTAQYPKAHAAITALGDSIDTPTRDALRFVVRQAEVRGLNLADPEGVGVTYRGFALATGVETVTADNKLSNRGRSVLRLLGRLRALGVTITIGRMYSPEHPQGVATAVHLPAAWVMTPGERRGM